MDLNTKIIEGVRQFPALYDNKVNLDERNQAWLQLAEKIKMHGNKVLCFGFIFVYIYIILNYVF